MSMKSIVSAIPACSIPSMDGWCTISGTLPENTDTVSKGYTRNPSNNEKRVLDRKSFTEVKLN